jgi:hypothetical protein
MPGCRRDKSPEKPAAGQPGDFAAATNRGKAYLENREAENCVAAFTAALTLRPESALAMRNLARGHLINTDAESTQAAIGQLQRALAVDATAVATNYLLGLAHARLGQYEAAVPVLERAVAGDPQTPAIRYQLAFVYEVTGANDKAAEQLAETVRLDPRHVSAHLRLANQARRGGDDATWKKHFDEWQRLRQLLGQPDEELLWRCRYTEAEAAPPEKADEAPRKVPAVDMKFVEWPGVFASEADAEAAAVCVIDVDEAGRPTIFAAEVGGGAALLKMSDQGVFVRTPVTVDAPIAELVYQGLAGNFRDEPPAEGKYDPKTHAMNDVLLVGTSGVSLLQRTGPTSFRNVTAAAGLAEAKALRSVWVDYEHDGDLDIAFAGGSGFSLWQNNGDGTFEDVTERSGLPVGESTRGVFAVDVDQDVAVDLLIGKQEAPAFYSNLRGGRFGLAEFPFARPSSAQQVLVADVDGDGGLEGVFGSPEAILLGRGAALGTLFKFHPGGRVATWMGFIDADNDGIREVLAGFVDATEDVPPVALRLLHLAGDGQDISERVGLTGLRLPSIRNALIADLDGDGDSDVLAVGVYGMRDFRLHAFRNDGGHANRQLKIRLLGTKTNTTGIGTRIEVRAGDFFAAHDVTSLPIEIGVGPRTKLDSIQTVWSNGVVDNQVDVDIADGKPVVIEEKNVATGSCPFLYVWDGEGFRFVTDLLGNAPVGLPLARGVLLDADPTEYVEIGPAAALPTKDGAYVAQVTSEFYEVLYFDEAKLVAVDHAPGVEVHSTDKLRPGPFPPSALVALSNRRPLAAATGDDGVDRTADLSEIDGRFAPCGAPQVVPYRGQTLPLAITMDFGKLDAAAPLVLALTGWLQYGQASTNIAMSQNRGLTVIPPRLEVETADGAWQDVDVVVGMPAGKTKTILVDLTGKLPEGARRLRLTTTFEIRWDRAALFDHLNDAERVVHHLAPQSATLRFRGFSEISFRQPGHPTTPDPNVIYPAPPWRWTLEGWCTRYGDVMELLAEQDGKMVVVNGGDCVDLSFDAAALPPVPSGLTRTMFFYSVGWDKDGDHNVVDGDTVEPLPGEHPPLTDGEKLNLDDWRIRYNTRWVPRDFFQRAAGGE